jgi:hypothetical protein
MPGSVQGSEYELLVKDFETKYGEYLELKHAVESRLSVFSSLRDELRTNPSPARDSLIFRVVVEERRLAEDTAHARLLARLQECTASLLAIKGRLRKHT